MAGRSTGRRPKPTAMKMAEGNPGKRPLNKHEPHPKPGAPCKPPLLTGDASDEWDRIVPQLLTLGLLTEVDGKALAAYCVSYGRWAAAEIEIARHGLLVDTPMGLKVNPAVRIARDAMSQLKQFLIEFGLSPASRSRLIVAPPEKQKREDESLAKPKPILRISAGGEG